MCALDILSSSILRALLPVVAEMFCPWLPGSVIMVLLPFLSLLHGNRAEGHNPRLSAVQAFSGLGRHVFRFEVVAMIYDKITTLYYSKAIHLFLPRAGVSNGCNPRISFLVSGDTGRKYPRPDT